MTTEKQVMNEIYDAALVTISAVTLSMVSKRIFREPLGTPDSLKGTAKLAIAVSAGTLLTRYLQGKKIIPIDPFKSM